MISWHTWDQKPAPGAAVGGCADCLLPVTEPAHLTAVVLHQKGTGSDDRTSSTSSTVFPLAHQPHSARSRWAADPSSVACVWGSRFSRPVQSLSVHLPVASPGGYSSPDGFYPDTARPRPVADGGRTPVGALATWCL